MMAAAQRLQLIDGGGGGAASGGGGGGASQVPLSHHILLDSGAAAAAAAAYHMVDGLGGGSFRFDPIVGSSTVTAAAATVTPNPLLAKNNVASGDGALVLAHHPHLHRHDHHEHHHHEHHLHEQQHHEQEQLHPHRHRLGGDAADRLDEWLWRQLPEKLVERILAMLPLPSFFRMRSVCKRWYSLLFSDSFLELWSRVTPPRHCFLLLAPGSSRSHAILFDPDERSWHAFPLAFLPPQIAVVSSSQGLLCGISEMAGFKTVILCNPLTRSCLQLPLTIKERFVPTVGLVVDGPARRYRLLVAGDDLISPFAVKNLSSEVYDSAAHGWRIAGSLPRLCNLESARTTFANGCFYCMNYSPFGVLAYDLELGTWSKIQAPMRRFLRTPNLVECRGRLVMVAAVEKNRLNVPKSIRIWGLQHPKNVWMELERMPQALYEEFMRVSAERAFYCVGHGNWILLTIADTPQMLMYDFYEKLWRWLPRCPFLGSEIEGFVQGFAFNPRLDSVLYPSDLCC